MVHRRVDEIPIELIEDVTTVEDDLNEMFCVPSDYMFTAILLSEGYSYSDVVELMDVYHLLTSEVIRWSKKDKCYKLRAVYPTFMDYKNALDEEGFDPNDYVFFREPYKFLDNEGNHEFWCRLHDIFSDLFSYRKEHGCTGSKFKSEIKAPGFVVPSFDEFQADNIQLVKEDMGDEVFEDRVAMQRGEYGVSWEHAEEMAKEMFRILDMEELEDGS